jgi:hypothetical protein
VPIPVIAIADDDFLYRRLSIKGHLNPDKTVNSNAYKKDGKPDPEISVNVATLSSVRECLLKAPDPASFTVGIIQTAKVRALGLTVLHQPTDDNPAHSVITGNNSKGTCRDLAKETRLATVEIVPGNNG